MGQDTPKPEAAASGPVKVETHRSRWDYPKEVAVGSKQSLHIVVTGDTLWDLAGKELGNPFSWPQIWELNQWIKDPHWIYPGDPLLIDATRSVIAKGEEKVGAQETTKGDAKEAVKGEEKSTEQADGDLADPNVREMRPDRRPNVPHRNELAYSFSDFVQMPFLAPKGAFSYYKEQGALNIAGAKNDLRSILSDGEVVYLTGGSDHGVKVGDRMVVMKTVESRFFHPDDKHRKTPIGDVIRNVGIVRVTSVAAKSSNAVIERCLSPISVGDHVAPFTEPATMITNLRTDIADPVVVTNPAKIVYAKDSREQLGQGELVIIDRGEADGLRMGDILLGAKVHTFPLNEAKTAKGVMKDSMSHYMGQVIVIRTAEHSATCRILRSIQEFQIGDIVTK